MRTLWEAKRQKWTFSNVSKFIYTKHEIPFDFRAICNSVGGSTTFTDLLTQWTEGRQYLLRVLLP